MSRLDMLFLLLIHTTVLLTITAQKNLTPSGQASQTSTFRVDTNAINAIQPPISNTFKNGNTIYCTHTTGYDDPNPQPAWWMFEFSFESAYITEIQIYYREGQAIRMDGFELYVTNTSTIPPVGYLCYKDSDAGLPNIFQNISCNQHGKYVIYYDTKGSFEGNRNLGPIVELCYVAINDNIASQGLVSQFPNGGQPAYMANDGIKTTCSKTQGTSVTFQVDLKEISIVTGLYILLGEDTTKEGYHSFYASNNSNTWNSGNVLYNGTILPTEISFQEVFRFLTYVPPVGNPLTELEICEMGIIGCPPSQYGHLCNTTCPHNCNGPCDLDVGYCILGCTNGWTGDTECHLGFYGNACLEPCSANCSNPKCNHVTGECIGGCKDGWQGFNCSQLKQKEYVHPEIV